MSYDYQIRLLESELKKLENGSDNKDLKRMTDIINDLRRLRRLKWEEEHERVNFDDDR